MAAETVVLFEYLKALAARLVPFGLRIDGLPDEPEGSLGVREPRLRGPGGRNLAAAVQNLTRNP
jgi:hypothetical protein